MRLGLKQNEVRLAPYTAEWKREFLRVKEELLKATDLQANQIEHIGSTAIEGLSAKPILDIVVGIDQLNPIEPLLLKGFKEVGFLQLKVQRPEEVVFAKFVDDTYQEKTHFIHLVVHEGELWKNLIFFRDYLNADEAERKHYLELKKSSLKQSSTDVNQYTDLKESFVKEIFAKRNE